MVRIPEKPARGHTDSTKTPPRVGPVILGVIVMFFVASALVIGLVPLGDSVIRGVLYLGLTVCVFMASVFLIRAALTWTLITDVRRTKFAELLSKISDPSSRAADDLAEVHHYDAAAQRVDNDHGAQVAFSVASVVDTDGYGVFAVRRAEDSVVAPAARSQVKAASSDDAIWSFLSEAYCDSSPDAASLPEASPGEVVHVAMYVDDVRVPKRPSRKGLTLSRIRLAMFRAAEKVTHPVIKALRKIRILDDVVITREAPTSAPRKMAAACTGAAVAIAAAAYHIVVSSSVNLIGLILVPVTAGALAAASVWCITCDRSVKVRQAARDRVAKAVRTPRGHMVLGVAAVVFAAVAVLLVTSSVLAALVAVVVLATIVVVTWSLVENRSVKHTHSDAVDSPPVLRLDIRSQAAAVAFIIGAYVFAVGL